MRAIYTIRYHDSVAWSSRTAKIIAKSWADALRTLKNSKGKKPVHGEYETIYHHLNDKEQTWRDRPEFLSKIIIPEDSCVLEISED